METKFGRKNACPLLVSLIRSFCTPFLKITRFRVVLILNLFITFTPMANIIKKTTGLTGLKVLANPREELISVYNKIIKVLQQLPDNAAYKGYTMATVQDRLKIVQNETDSNQIEKKIGCGQCEELLVQAENELSLARRISFDKSWEPLVNKPPENQWKWPI